MIDKVKGLELLKKTIEGNLTHQDYQHTVELAEKYLAIITGQGIDKLLQQFVRREDKDLFEQRKKITQAITPEVAEAIMNPFYKITRTNRVYSSIDGLEEASHKELQQALKKFWGEGEQSGLDYFMATRFVELIFTDPNSFIAVEFDAFDPKVEKAQPKPIEISSEAAINYEYRNGILQWLIASWENTYKKKEGATGKGKRYVMYLGDDAIELNEVDPKERITDLQDPVFIEIGKDNQAKRVFTIQYYEPKAGVVPAVRVGYKRDLTTKGRTNVSPLHPALPSFMKSIKTVSELDLTMTLHAFPQKLQYVQPCVGESGKGCTNGKTRAGSTCNLCKGTGTPPVHTSAHDIILLPLPKDKESMVPLDGLLTYKNPPIDLVKFQDEYIQRLRITAMRAIFNGDQFVKNTVAATATEKDMDMEAVYDTLAPFARKYSSAWMQIVKLCAVYTENYSEEVEIYHKFPSDFKLKGQKALLEELKLASESNAPSYVIDNINKDLLEQMYADDQDTLAKLKVRARFFPFNGKTPEQIQLILMSDVATRYAKILFANFEEIFQRIDQRLGDKFYVLADDKQKKEIDGEVNTIMKAVDKEKASQVQLFKQPGQEPGEDQNPEA